MSANISLSDKIAGFHPFLDLLDPKDFKEYYQIIQHPVSIKQIHKRVKGVHGKKAATGVSDYKHWAAFEEEMSYLWKNAFEYNQDGSDIFVLAEELQVCQLFSTARGLCILNLCRNSSISA